MHRAVSIGKGASVCVSAFALLLSVAPLFAQSDRGTIIGTVTDPSGAVIVGATVSATNKATGLSTRVTTTTAGTYTIPSLQIGPYEVAVEQSGFKKFVRSGIVVEVGQTARVDAALQLGQSTEVVNVSGSADQVQRDTTDRGNVVSNRDVLELPIVGQGEQRNPAYFMILAPGVTGRGISGGGSPRMLNTTVNGSQSASNEFQIDGAIVGSVAEWAGDFRNIPFPQDVVAEFKVITLNPAAEFGRTGQGITTFTLKSGTNQLHGSVYEFVRNCTPTAPNDPNDHFCLAARGFYPAKSAITKQNEFGATVGGPIFKDKTFFYGWYQGFRLRKGTGSNFTDTVPTAAMRGGNLSNILGAQIDTDPVTPGLQGAVDALGRPVYQGQIFDPTTDRLVGGVRVRDAFGFDPVTGLAIPGAANIIPSNRIDSVAANIMAQFPDPNRGFDTGFGFQQNWISASFSRPKTDQYGGKIDHAFSDTQRINGSFIWLKNNDQPGGRYPSPIGEGGISETKQGIARFSHDWIIRPNLINHWTAGFNRWDSVSISEAGLGWPGKLGWTGVPQDGPGSVFPGLNIAGLGNTYGNGGQGYDVANTYTIDESLTWTKGRHTVKSGFTYVKLQGNDGGFGRQSGYLTFNCGQTAQPGFFSDSCGAGSGGTGFGLSSFLLGLGTVGEADVYAAVNGERMGQYAGYVQDDFKVSSKLTMNLGLRYDLILPTVDVHNVRSWMDPSAPNPALGGFPGTVIFADDNLRTGVRTFKRGFGPRVGLAYSVNSKTVLRAGYGILYTTGGGQRGTRGLYVQGYNTANFVQLTNGGLDPAFSFSPFTSPLVGGVSTPGGWPASLFPAPPFIDPTYGFNGGPRPMYPGDGRGPTIHNWNFTVQRQLPGMVLLDVSYVGTRGTHLVSRVLPTNVMPTYLMTKYGLNAGRPVGATGPGDLGVAPFLPLCPTTANPLQSCGLNSPISDPAVQALPEIQAMPVDAVTGNHSPFTGFETLVPNPTVGQALRPLPQYQQESNSQLRRWTEGVGLSTYHSLQVQARKQMSNGLSFLASYTWSRSLTDAESIFGEFSGFTQDFYNRKAEMSYGINDYPHNLVLSYQYQLPFGPGKKWVNTGGAAGKIVGGWSIAGIQQYQSGPPQFLWGGGGAFPYTGPNSFLIHPNVVPGVGQKSVALETNQWDPNGLGAAGARWNINAFSAAPANTFGNGPRMYAGDLRRQSYLNEDISFIKRTSITERVSLEFRADFLNIFNRTVFGFDQGGDQYGSALAGAFVADTSGFGHVGSQGNYPREIQFGLKINY